MPRTLIPSTSQEEAKRKQLLTVIRKKRKELQQIVIRVEMLRVHIEIAKQEYMVKIGNLFLKDNTLDLEIIRLNNILHLMEEGSTYDQAVEKINRTYYAEQLELEKERAKIKFEEEIYIKREEQKPKITVDFKKLWKKLIARFHPDLVQNQTEKKKRETIMKQINKAYEEGDYEQLLKIEKEHSASKETSIENLEESLLSLMKDIDEQLVIETDLKASEWYDWMIKIDMAKKKNKDIFAETEQKLLDDIVVKIDQIKLIKQQIQEKEKGLILV